MKILFSLIALVIALFIILELTLWTAHLDRKKPCPPCPQVRDTVIVKDTVVAYKVKTVGTRRTARPITH